MRAFGHEWKEVSAKEKAEFVEEGSVDADDRVYVTGKGENRCWFFPDGCYGDLGRYRQGAELCDSEGIRWSVRYLDGPRESEADSDVVDERLTTRPL